MSLTITTKCRNHFGRCPTVKWCKAAKKEKRCYCDILELFSYFFIIFLWIYRFTMWSCKNISKPFYFFLEIHFIRLCRPTGCFFITWVFYNNVRASQNALDIYEKNYEPRNFMFYLNFRGENVGKTVKMLNLTNGLNFFIAPCIIC